MQVELIIKYCMLVNIDQGLKPPDFTGTILHIAVHLKSSTYIGLETSRSHWPIIFLLLWLKDNVASEPNYWWWHVSQLSIDQQAKYQGTSKSSSHSQFELILAQRAVRSKFSRLRARQTSLKNRLNTERCDTVLLVLVMKQIHYMCVYISWQQAGCCCS